MIAAPTQRIATVAPIPALTGTRWPTGPGIYRLLPLTARQLTLAVATAATFTALYGTYSYTQLPSAYLARLRPYTAPELQAALASAATTPGMLELRDKHRAAARCTATTTTIRDIASTSITVLVTARQATRIYGTTHATVQDYALTLAPGSTHWVVYDFEPATAGQAGSTP